MATIAAPSRKDVKVYTFLWEGMDRNNRQVRGEIKAASETVVTTNLRRQGVRITNSSASHFAAAARWARRKSPSSPASWPPCSNPVCPCCNPSRSSRADTTIRGSRA